MILEHLAHAWKSSKFAPSWIISNQDEEKALEKVTEFASSIFANTNNGNLPIAHNPDFRIIKREKNNTGTESKFIVIDQIREIQKFLNKTATLGAYKIVIIYQAHLMNINSSNCCLKILEEAPKNSFIFLITSAPSLLLPTITSRCAKIYINKRAEACVDESEYLEFLSFLSDRKLFVKKITSNFDKKSFETFASCVIYHFSRMDKSAMIDSTLFKYDNIIKIISKTRELDLDHKVSAIIILEELSL